jgi:hypothetical protein
VILANLLGRRPVKHQCHHWWTVLGVACQFSADLSYEAKYCLRRLRSIPDRSQLDLGKYISSAEDMCGGYLGSFADDERRDARCGFRKRHVACCSLREVRLGGCLPSRGLSAVST